MIKVVLHKIIYWSIILITILRASSLFSQVPVISIPQPAEIGRFDNFRQTSPQKPSGISSSRDALIQRQNEAIMREVKENERRRAAINRQYAIQKYWKNIRFNLILYSTPPITFNRIIASLKKRYNAKSYLLLKDIFPQNAVDLGMFSKNSLLYKFFRRKEERLYQLSDYIGCMSPANVEYLLKHNQFIKAETVELCPNSIELQKNSEWLESDRKALLRNLNIPIDKLLFIYGGNLGRPQGVDFLMKVIAANENRDDTFFVIVGNGTEYGKMKRWFESNTLRNACLLSSLPKENYDKLVRSCDIGLIFLDKHFTIPNYPSRLLSYLENGMPVLLATDVNTDIGRIAEVNGYGLWTESGNLDMFMELVAWMSENREQRKVMGEKGYSYLLSNYTVENG